MKNIYFIVLFLFASISDAQILSFQDANFKNALVNTPCIDTNGDNAVDSDADLNNDGEIDQAEALLVTYLSVNYASINSLSGVEYFSNLVNLNCYNNNLTNLNVSSLSHLEGLNCDSNQLTSLNISNLNELQYLSCNFNQLTNINFENHPSLTNVWCGNNLFTDLNICGSAVSFFWCNDNPYLQHLSLKNGVVTHLNTSKLVLTPPCGYPLPAFNLINLPVLNSLCYDEGELAEINFFSSGFNPIGVALTTDCDSNCLLTNPVFQNSSVTVFPNPTKDMLYFESGSAYNINQIDIYNILGELLISKSMNTNKPISIDVSQLNSGTYLIHIKTNQGSQNTKFIKL